MNEEAENTEINYDQINEVNLETLLSELENLSELNSQEIKKILDDHRKENKKEWADQPPHYSLWQSLSAYYSMLNTSETGRIAISNVRIVDENGKKVVQYKLE